jgi:hypothetical protein
MLSKIVGIRCIAAFAEANLIGVPLLH